MFEPTSDSPASTAKEPCAGCGEETGAGTMFYSDRRWTTLADGRRVAVCSDCLARASAARTGKPVFEDDLRVIAANGLMVGVGLLGGGTTG